MGEFATLLTTILLPMMAAIVVPIYVYRAYLSETLRGSIRAYPLEGQVLLIMPNRDIHVRARSLANALGILIFSVGIAGAVLGIIALGLDGGSFALAELLPRGILLVVMIIFFAVAFVIAWRSLRQARITFNLTAKQIQITRVRGEGGEWLPFSAIRAVVLEQRPVEGDDSTRWNVGLQTDTDAYYIGGRIGVPAEAFDYMQTVANEIAAVVGARVISLDPNRSTT